MSSALFGIGGAAVGIAQVWLLARSAGGRSHTQSFLIRLLLVAGVLVFAAVTGHVVSGALGWLMGFGVALAVMGRRLG